MIGIDRVSVAQAVAIGVGDQWIGVIVVDFVAVFQPVPIGIRVVRVGAQLKFLKIGEAIAIWIVAGLRLIAGLGGGVAEVLHQPGIGNPISIAVHQRAVDLSLGLAD